MDYLIRHKNSCEGKLFISLEMDKFVKLSLLKMEARV